MKLGLLGLPQVGKATLFSLLTGTAVTPERRRPLPGVARTWDSRLEKLSEMYHPQKTTPATFEVHLLPPLEETQKEALNHAGLLDVLLHVVRCFEREDVFSLHGSVDPLRDVEWLERELCLHDWLFLEKRLERIAKEQRGKKGTPPEKELLERMKQHVEEEKPLRVFPLGAQEEKWIRSYPLLSRKPLIVVLNIDDTTLGKKARELEEKVREKLPQAQVVAIPLQLEAEVAELDEEEREAFVEEFGLGERPLETLSRLCLEALGRLTFFTVGEDEVRAWTVRRGAKAPEAAGVIHSDLERGFIRAEVMKYDELIEAGDEKKLKEAGKVYLKGKDYVVEEGDILHILFRV